MKPKTALVILVVLSLGLAAGLIYRHNTAVAQKRVDDDRSRYLSNQWAETSTKLNAQIDVNNTLTANLQAKASELEKTSAVLDETRSSLTQAVAEIKLTKQELESTQAEVAKRDARIAELESANLVLDKQASEMKTAISDLEGKISDTERKLAASEGDREFLLKELKRLQAEKAELERRFNDLVVLREQVKKLKEELAIARRLDWIRKGLYGSSPKKGAELLQSGMKAGRSETRTNVDLNVEVSRDGTATIVAPTNAPTSTNAPANPQVK